mgnify:FL=1
MQKATYMTSLIIGIANCSFVQMKACMLPQKDKFLRFLAWRTPFQAAFGNWIYHIIYIL